MKKRYSILLRIFISFGLLSALLWFMRDDADAIVKTLLGCDSRFILTALFIFTINTAVLACRMKIVFHGENLDITFFESFQLTFIGFFFIKFLLTSTAYSLQTPWARSFSIVSSSFYDHCHALALRNQAWYRSRILRTPNIQQSLFSGNIAASCRMEAPLQHDTPCGSGI